MDNTCKHEYNLDGGKCIRCGMTVAETIHVGGTPLNRKLNMELLQKKDMDKQKVIFKLYLIKKD